MIISSCVTFLSIRLLKIQSNYNYDWGLFVLDNTYRMMTCCLILYHIVTIGVRIYKLSSCWQDLRLGLPMLDLTKDYSTRYFLLTFSKEERVEIWWVIQDITRAVSVVYSFDVDIWCLEYTYDGESLILFTSCCLY